MLLPCQHFTPADALLCAYGFILPFALSNAEAALVVGLANVAVVALFKYLALRRRTRQDEEIAQLNERIAQLEAERDSAPRPPA